MLAQPLPYSPKSDPVTAKALDRFLQMIEGRYPVCGAILFGSRARGTHEADSDADLAVILRGSPETGNYSRERMSIALDMSRSAYNAMFETGVIVSPFPIWQEEYEASKPKFNRILLQNIHREGVKIA